MSRLLDELTRDLAEAAGQERYTDFAIVVRRLTLRYTGARPAPGPCQSKDGTSWRIPDRSCDHLIPLSTETIRDAQRFTDGCELYRNNQVIGTLSVEIIAAAGGVWDALYNNWALDEQGERLIAKSPVIFDVRESQVAIMRSFASWLRAFRARDHSVEQDGAILYGGRRSGKTVIGHLAVILAAVDLGRIDNTPLVAWLVSTNHPARVELDREFRVMMPASWYIYREMPSVIGPAHSYTLLNGAQITHRTADDPEALRVGRCDIALLNEAGKMAKLAFQNTVNAIADKGGYVLLTSNRPRKTKANWVALLAKEQRKLGSKATLPFFELDPALNDAIRQDTRRRVLDMLHQLDPDDADEGELMEVGSYVYTPPFDDLHLVDMPELGLPDLTREVSRKIGGVERDFLVGTDFQGRPAMVASAWKVVGRLPDQWHLWCVQSFFVEESDEDGLIDELLGEDYTPENSLIIGDASGQWQKGDHKAGPTSFRFFRSRRYVITGAQKKIGQSGQYSCNPRPKEAAVGRVNSLMRSERANGYRALMVNAVEHASTMAISLRKCRAGRGRFGVIPVGDHAHLTDTATYVAWAVMSVLHHAEARAKAGGTRRKTLAEMRAEANRR